MQNDPVNFTDPSGLLPEEVARFYTIDRAPHRSLSGGSVFDRDFNTPFDELGQYVPYDPDPVDPQKPAPQPPENPPSKPSKGFLDCFEKNKFSSLSNKQKTSASPPAGA